MERDNEPIKPQQHKEFTKLRRTISLNREKGLNPTTDQVDRLRELDDWLSNNTIYWKRHYAKPDNEE